MVLDPFSALGLAGNIVQFVDFSSELFSKSKEIYKSASGATGENQELHKATETLRCLCGTLKRQGQAGSKSVPRSNDEAKLTELASRCNDTALELLSALEALRAKRPHKRFDCLHNALKAVWTKDRIKAMENKLASYRSQLMLQLSAMQDERQSSILLALQNLSDANRQMGIDVASDVMSLRTDMLKALKQLHTAILEHTVRDTTKDFLKLASKADKRTQEKVDVVAVSKKLEYLTDVGNKIATGQKILKSLRFTTMKVRHSKIAGAHPNTFKWMFERPTDPCLRVRFVEWLQSDNPIYWISGKPGSGKSTLMKYLVDEPRTRAILQTWADRKTLVTASFFFWIAGTEMQKSQEGLLQSLLYEVLKQCPYLIPLTFPSRWEASNLYLDHPDPWTRPELLEAFERLRKCDLASTRFCFFIDGLDEYEGDHMELIEVIRGLIDSSNVKVCLSSRPWNVFETAFGADPVRKLYLQDLNQADIKLYVKNKLQDRSDFEKLMHGDNRCNDLVVEIVDKAKGVFLWVYLVVRSLVQGLHNCDRIIDLQRRVKEFPADLADYFKHILTSLDPIYREQTARAFQASLHAARPLSLLNYWFLDLDEENPDFAMNMKTYPLTSSDISSRHNEMKRRINGRCKGLLEVCLDRPHCDLPFKYNVDFLHRTVRDFLLTRDMQGLLDDWTSATFDANIAICRGILAELKSLEAKFGYLQHPGPLSELVGDFMYHAREVELRTNSSPVALVEALGAAIAHFTQLCPTQSQKAGLEVSWESWVEERNFQYNSYNSLLTFAIEKNLVLYVQWKLEHNIELLRKKKGRPLLDYALRPTPRSAHDNTPNMQMAAMLLDHGADPNQRWANSTVWSHYLQTWSTCLSRWPQDVLYGSIKTLILRGADRDAKVKVDDIYLRYPSDSLAQARRSEGCGTAKMVEACQLFSQIFSTHDAAELNDIMYPKGRYRIMSWIGWK